MNTNASGSAFLTNLFTRRVSLASSPVKRESFSIFKGFSPAFGTQFSTIGKKYTIENRFIYFLVAYWLCRSGAKDRQHLREPLHGQLKKGNLQLHQRGRTFIEWFLSTPG